MKTNFSYRSYDISNEDGRYVAKSLDGEDCVFESANVLTLLRGIDLLWAVLEGSSEIPAWFTQWMANPIKINLDQIQKSDSDPCNVCPFPVAPKLNTSSRMAMAVTALLAISAPLTEMLFTLPAVA